MLEEKKCCKADAKTPYYAAVEDSLVQIMRKIPRNLYKKDLYKTWASIAKTTLSIFASGLLTVACYNELPNPINLVAAFMVSWFLLGTAITGAFDLAHDAAHRSLFEKREINDFFGHIFSSVVGWPFHLWRIAHDAHHAHTNNAKRDIAWEPYTLEKIERMPQPFRFLYKKFRSSLFFVWAGGFFHLLEQLIKFSRGSSRFRGEGALVAKSVVITSLIFGAVVFLIAYLGGLPGLVFLAMIPLCRYYYWLSVFTLLHHTRQDRPFVPDHLWKDHAGAIQLTGTINVRYGWLVDFLTHDIAWHVPHHISVAIPHYNLKAATEALMEAYPGVIEDQKFTLGYLRQVLRTCHYVKSLEETEWKAFK